MHGREMGRTGEMLRSPVGFDYLHVAIDDHSRVAFVQAHRDERAPTCVAFLRDAVAFFAEHGVAIERVMTDNARNYPRRSSSNEHWTNSASLIDGPGTTDHRPMAKQSDSIAPCSRSLPTRRSSHRTQIAWKRLAHRSTPTIQFDLTRRSAGSPRCCSGSVNNADGNYK